MTSPTGPYADAFTPVACVCGRSAAVMTSLDRSTNSARVTVECDHGGPESGSTVVTSNRVLYPLNVVEQNRAARRKIAPLAGRILGESEVVVQVPQLKPLTPAEQARSRAAIHNREVPIGIVESGDLLRDGRGDYLVVVAKVKELGEHWRVTFRRVGDDRYVRDRLHGRDTYVLVATAMQCCGDPDARVVELRAKVEAAQAKKVDRREKTLDAVEGSAAGREVTVRTMYGDDDLTAKAIREEMGRNLLAPNLGDRVRVRRGKWAGTTGVVRKISAWRMGGEVEIAYDVELASGRVETIGQLYGVERAP